MIHLRSIVLDPGVSCAPPRAGLVVRSPERVLATTGCGFYAIDTTTDSVVRLDTRGDTIDDDGDTVAVITSKLGLSRDGGRTFDWTDWSLGRCQGTPWLTAGDGFAIVTCVAGVGRWRGAGTAFEMLTPGGQAPIVAVAAAHGSSVMINDTNGWFASADAGENFASFDTSGLPDRPDPYSMQIVGSKLFVAAPAAGGEQVALFSTALDRGAFTRVEAFPSATGQLVLGDGKGGLLVRAGNQFILSTDGGASFETLPVAEFSHFDAAAKYHDGRLYVVADGTLFVETTH